MAEHELTITGDTHLLRRQRNARQHTLEQFEGDGAPRTIVIEGDGVVIGRAPDATVRVASKSASRYHAALKVRGTDCVITDNDSHNGIYLNTVKVNSAVLRDGDVVQVADCAFVYYED